MTFNFSVTENPELLEEVKPGDYQVYLTLTLANVDDFDFGVKESLRKFLGENLYDKSTTTFEYVLRGILFGQGMKKKDIDKTIKKIKNTWKKAKKVGDYSVDV